MSAGCIAPGCERRRAPGSLFCRGCEQAPAARRGGWLSAEKRRRKLAGDHERAIDASNIATRLWVGSLPPLDRDLPEFDMLVLCVEDQPEHVAFHGKVIRCPIPDSALSSHEAIRAATAARAVAEALSNGCRVLIVCAAGMNRSALVAALALAKLTTMSSAAIIRLVRANRHPQALCNPHFRSLIRSVARDGRPAFRR